MAQEMIRRAKELRSERKLIPLPSMAIPKRMTKSIVKPCESPSKMLVVDRDDATNKIKIRILREEENKKAECSKAGSGGNELKPN